MLEGFALALNATFHLFAQLLIDLEVLNLELAIPLFLCVNELGRHAELHLLVIQEWRPTAAGISQV